jgi:putative glutamine amidotransferase
MLEGTEPEVNSLHHQGVADAGGATPVAWAPDRVVEALEKTDAPFTVGVQWHPEKMDAEHRRRVFGAFVSACGSGGS